jgi:hypothetical protein
VVDNRAKANAALVSVSGTTTLAGAAPGAAWAALFLIGNLFAGGAVLALMQIASWVISALDQSCSRPCRTGFSAVCPACTSPPTAMAGLPLAVFDGLLAVFGARAVGVATSCACVIVDAGGGSAAHALTPIPTRKQQTTVG